jgi:glutathione S-transferase
MLLVRISLIIDVVIQITIEAEALASNLGRMPIVSDSDVGSIGQSTAINYYIAAKYNLLGDSLFESAKCMEVMAHIGEIKTAWYKLVPYGSTPTEEQLKTWFEEGGDDRTGVAGSRGDRQMKWFVGRLEEGLAGKDGFAVGNRISLADILLYNCFAEVLTAAELGDAPSDGAKGAQFPFTSLEKTNAILTSCPRITASINHVRNNANIQKYLNDRGVQMF